MKLIALPVLGASLCASLSLAADTTINSVNKYAYGANIGWINLSGDNTGGVVVGEFFLSGSAYGANVGWISFGDGSPSNGSAYSNQSATDFGVNQDGAGNLAGFAYGANIGWINFGWAGPDDPDRPRVNLSTGGFQGFAYGANVGWINLGAGYLATDTLFCNDGDGDGISDVWETLHFGDLTTADTTSNRDGDPASDKEEYFGGSDPQDASSFLRVVAQGSIPFKRTTRKITIEFTSSPSRLYRIAVSDDLRTFTDSGLGTVSPSTGTTTTTSFQGDIKNQFYRVIAVKPLQP